MLPRNLRAEKSSRNQGQIEQLSKRAFHPIGNLDPVAARLAEIEMPDIQPRRLDDGGIDYGHYRRRAQRLRIEARRRAGLQCLQRTRRLIGAAAVAAAFVLIPPGTADCVIGGPTPSSLVVAPTR
jgi:hypothetical protein